MMRRLLPLLLLPLVAGACKRDPSGTDGPIALVLVSPDARVLARAETLALEATVRDRGGEQPSEARLAKLAWSSDAPAVATVSGGVVTAVAPGTATIRAELEGVSGSVQVSVADPAASCASPDALASLPVGGSVTLGGVAASLLCLEGGETGRDYVVVPFNASGTGAGFASVTVSAQGVVPPAPGSLVSPALSLEAAGPRPDDGFHARLRARAAEDLAPLLAAAREAAAGAGPMAPGFAIGLRNPAVGQRAQVNTSLASCDSAKMRTGRVVAVGSRSVVMVDTANPPGGLTDAEYASFAAGFDTLVWPVVAGAFGEPRDVDGNSRAIIFYTRAVNELTQPGSGSYVGGYFHPRDLFPTRKSDGLSACATSNVAEIFYMLVPDPGGTINNNAFPRELVLEKSLGTIAHEFQHLINASRRLYVVGTTHWNEETWLNEGLSHLAEELVFYRASGLAPGRNIRSADVSTDRAGTAFGKYQEENIRRLDRYLQDVETQSAYDFAPNSSSDNNDLATRGAAWAFLRYAADRRGGDQAALWRSLVDGSTVGLPNLQQALGTDPRPWARDWAASLYADDRVPGLAPKHTQPSWHFRSFWSQYPLRVRTVSTGGSTTLSIKAGTAGFVRMGVPALTTARIGASSGGAALPSSVFVTVVRTR